jgi:hypothetical protein
VTEVAHPPHRRSGGSAIAASHTTYELFSNGQGECLRAIRSEGSPLKYVRPAREHLLNKRVWIEGSEMRKVPN